MQYYINVSTETLAILQSSFALQCQSWHLVLLIELRQLSMLWQQVRDAEVTSVMKAFLNLVKLLLCSIWNGERQFHHSLSAGDFSYSWGKFLTKLLVMW